MKGLSFFPQSHPKKLSCKKSTLKYATSVSFQIHITTYSVMFFDIAVRNNVVKYPKNQESSIRLLSLC